MSEKFEGGARSPEAEDKKSLFPASLFEDPFKDKNTFGYVREVSEIPPEGKNVGYHSWSENDDKGEPVYMKSEYYVLPDGSAKIVHTEGDNVSEEVIPQGQWSIENMSGSFGSYGGRRIVKKLEE